MKNNNFTHIKYNIQNCHTQVKKLLGRFCNHSNSNKKILSHEFDVCVVLKISTNKVNMFGISLHYLFVYTIHNEDFNKHLKHILLLLLITPA